MDPDPLKIKIQNIQAGNLTIVGFCNLRENFIKTGQSNKETDFYNVTNPKSCFKIKSKSRIKHALY